jgi:hypothetical protein
MRLVTLSEDIAIVKCVTVLAKKRRSTPDMVTSLIDILNTSSVWIPVRDAVTLVNNLIEAMKTDHLLRSRLEGHDLAATLVPLREKLTAAKARLAEVNDELPSIAHSVVMSQLDDVDLTKSLVNRCTTLEEDIRTLRERLHTEDARAVWDDYEKVLNTDCQDLFADYVDFLGGLTLRDTALDDQVCSITDALLTEIPGGRMKHLAIPSRRPTLNSAMTKLVKLGFPEWTIWNIPLVGYEIGLAHTPKAMGRRLIARTAASLPDRSPDTQAVLVAEAYAAYTIGPAYGCAATLLRFQPNHDSALEERPSDVDRAAVILAVLDRTGRQAAGFNGVVDKTREYWLEAVADLSDVAAGGTPGDMEPFAAAVCAGLEAESIKPFDPGGWEAVDELAKVLQKAVPLDKSTPANTKARLLLNAAWTARLKVPGNRDWADRITKNVKVLWKSILDRTPPQGGHHGQS